MFWQNILIIGIIGLGIIIPYLIRRKVLGDTRWTHLIALVVIFLAATIVSYLGYQFSRTDPGTMFTRAVLVDGISLYVLNYPPLQGR
jgi:hypothetical protein